MHDRHRDAELIHERMRVVNGIERFRNHVKMHVPREGKPFAGGTLQDGRKGLTFQVFHREVGAIAVLTDVKRLHNICMVQLGSKARLLEKHTRQILIFLVGL
jgi:hypothetical protein